MIEKTSLEDFTYWYKKSDIKRYIRDISLWQMPKFKTRYGDAVIFYLIKNQVGKVVAGTCIVHDEETKQSIYQFAFMGKEKEYKYVGVGLITFCVEETLKRGFPFLNLTGVWAPGYPRSWKGLTTFKMQFAPRIVRCVGTYVRAAYQQRKSS